MFNTGFVVWHDLQLGSHQYKFTHCNVIPFKQFGEFFFSESFQEVEKNVKAHGKVGIGHAMELGKRYPSSYIPNADLFIVFVEDGSAVRYVETKADTVILECNLLATPPKEIKKYFSKYDDLITLNDD